ncbi:unnamed protein product, partial [Symbiodinium sp. KB8]
PIAKPGGHESWWITPWPDGGKADAKTPMQQVDLPSVLHDLHHDPQAQDAATKGDLYQMWSVVKRLAPKTKFRRVQLHKHGNIMAPEAELDWIAQAFGERYGAAHSVSPGPMCRQHPPVQVLMTDVKAALQQLPARKAVPPGAVPSALWKACANQLAGPLTVAVNEAWRQPLVEIQQPWADADVALLPKGSKKAKTPLDLRPIGLQHPLGKTMMKVITLQAKDCIAALVKRWPQTAYVPGRSTTTALKVVMSHCADVRTACAGTRLNIHQKHEGQHHAKESGSFHGGLQVSLDLTAAFDLVNWGHLREALALAEIDPSIQELLLQWLRTRAMPFEEPDQEMAEFFGTVKPPPTSLAPGAMADSTKRRRETDQGHGRLALRHEEEIRLLQQDTTLVLWFSPGQDLPKKAADMGWRDDKGWFYQVTDVDMTNKLEFFITHLKRDVVH